MKVADSVRHRALLASLSGMLMVMALGSPAVAGPPRPLFGEGSGIERVPQRVGGVRVRGGGEVLRRDAAGHVLWRSGRELEVTVSTVPRVDVASALAQVAPRRVVSRELVVLPWRPGGLLAWEIVVAGMPPERVVVDAHSGAVLASGTIAHEVRGRVYAQHPKAGAPIEVTLEGLAAGASTLQGDDLYVASLVFNGGGEPGVLQRAVADANGDYLYDPDAAIDDDAFAEVNAWWHVTNVGRFFKDTFGVDPLAQTWVTVNYREAPGEPYENAYAYIDPEADRFIIVAGQADGIDMAYDGMVLAHEYGHPVFDLLTDISENNTYPINSDAKGFHPAPHAINEGASDYWAATIFDDPIVLATFDEEISARRLDNDRRCPNDVWGEAHLDAPLVSGTFWKVREAIGREDADALVFQVLSWLSDSPTFDELGTRIDDAARSLEERGRLTASEVAAVHEVVVARGLVGCGREIAIADDTPFTANMPGAETAASLAGVGPEICDSLRLLGVQIPLAFSYKTTAPSVEAARLEALEIDLSFVRADGKPVAEGDLQYQLVVRKDAPVGLEVLSIPFSGQEFQLPIRAIDYDAVVDGQPTHVRFTAAELELVPGATYYLNVLALNCPLTTHTTTLRWVVAPEASDDVAEGDVVEDDVVEADAEVGDVVESDAAEGAAATVSGGCGGCAGGGHEVGLGLGVMIMMSMVLRGRGARSSSSSSPRAARRA